MHAILVRKRVTNTALSKQKPISIAEYVHNKNYSTEERVEMTSIMPVHGY